MEAAYKEYNLSTKNEIKSITFSHCAFDLDDLFESDTPAVATSAQLTNTDENDKENCMDVENYGIITSSTSDNVSCNSSSSGCSSSSKNAVDHHITTIDNIEHCTDPPTYLNQIKSSNTNSNRICKIGLPVIPSSKVAHENPLINCFLCYNSLITALHYKLFSAWCMKCNQQLPDKIVIALYNICSNYEYPIELITHASQTLVNLFNSKLSTWSPTLEMIRSTLASFDFSNAIITDDNTTAVAKSSTYKFDDKQGDTAISVHRMDAIKCWLDVMKAAFSNNFSSRTAAVSQYPTYELITIAKVMICMSIDRNIQQNEMCNHMSRDAVDNILCRIFGRIITTNSTTTKATIDATDAMMCDRDSRQTSSTCYCLQKFVQRSNSNGDCMHKTAANSDVIQSLIDMFDKMVSDGRLSCIDLCHVTAALPIGVEGSTFVYHYFFDTCVEKLLNHYPYNTSADGNSSSSKITHSSDSDDDCISSKITSITNQVNASIKSNSTTIDINLISWLFAYFSVITSIIKSCGIYWSKNECNDVLNTCLTTSSYLCKYDITRTQCVLNIINMIESTLQNYKH